MLHHCCQWLAVAQLQMLLLQVLHLDATRSDAAEKCSVLQVMRVLVLLLLPLLLQARNPIQVYHPPGTAAAAAAVALLLPVYHQHQQQLLLLLLSASAVLPQPEAGMTQHSPC
jgi:hypothetical protein